MLDRRVGGLASAFPGLPTANRGLRRRQPSAGRPAITRSSARGGASIHVTADVERDVQPSIALSFHAGR